MSDKDDFYGMAEESSRLLARQADARGLGGETPKLTRAAPPRAPAAMIAPRQPFDATAAGHKVRAGITRDVNALAGATENSINATTLPFRAVSGITRDFTRAVLGQKPGADAGTTPGAIRLPRMGATPAAATAPRAEPSRAARHRKPGTPATPAAAVVQAPSGVTRTVGADGVPTYTGTPGAAPAMNLGTFSGDQGPQPRITRSSAAAPPGAAFDPQGIARSTVGDLRNVASIVRNDAAAGINPMSADAEIMRRLQHSGRSYFNKGSPSARAAQAQVYLGQLGARLGASEQFQGGAGQVLQAGAEGAIREGLDAKALEGSAALRRQGLEGAVEMAALAENKPRLIRNSADGILRVRRGTTSAPVTDENGLPVRQAPTPAAGALTPQDLLEAYTTEREAIVGSLASPSEKAAAMAELESKPLYGPILGQGAAIPTLASFLVGARAANPEATEQELTDYYRNEYGAP